MASPPDEDATRARRRARRTAAQVFAVEIVTLIALWLLNASFGTP